MLYTLGMAVLAGLGVDVVIKMASDRLVVPRADHSALDPQIRPIPTQLPTKCLRLLAPASVGAACRVGSSAGSP